VTGVQTCALPIYWTGAWYAADHSTTGAAALGLLAGCLAFFFFWAGAGGFDRYVVDGLVNGTAYFSGFVGILMRKLQTGRVQTYVAFAIFGVMILFFLFR
jgi:hypothetical protein